MCGSTPLIVFLLGLMIQLNFQNSIFVLHKHSTDFGSIMLYFYFCQLFLQLTLCLKEGDMLCEWSLFHIQEWSGGYAGWCLQ
jgi:hypothetical protein